MFRLVVSKNQIAVAQTEPMTSGSVDVYKILFEFSDDWDGFERYAVFEDEEARIEIPLDETNICDIPWEVMSDPGDMVEAGVYGIKGQQVLPTIWAELGEIQEGVLQGDAPSPTPSGWQQTVSQLKANKGDNLEYDAGHLKLRSGENVLSSVKIVTDGINDEEKTLAMSAAGVEAIVGNVEVLLRLI